MDRKILKFVTAKVKNKTRILETPNKRTALGNSSEEIWIAAIVLGVRAKVQEMVGGEDEEEEEAEEGEEEDFKTETINLM